MTKSVIILNGRNLNLLGKRQPNIYGNQTLDDIKVSCEKFCKNKGMNLDFRQTNSEGQLVNWIQESDNFCQGMVINPGAYSHTSIAVMDALLTCKFPIIEVHLSNIHRREEFRHNSFVSRAATSVICGMGGFGYVLALEGLTFQLESN